MFKKLLLPCLAGLLVSPDAMAQQPSPDTTGNPDDNLIVYGVRLAQPQTEVGSSVSIITAEDIDALGFDFAVDAIAAAPGVTVNQNGTFGGTANVRIRGADTEQTLILIDGVVVNDPTSPGGGFNIARLDPGNIERIEILKGPQSTLWGTDAIGGVVNIITKRPADGFNGSVFTEYGSFNSLRAGAAITGANGTGDFRLALSGFSTDGISKADERNGNTEDDSFDSTTVAARGGLNLPAEIRLDATLLLTDGESEFDSFSFGAEGNVADSDDLSETDELSASLSATIPLLDGRLENLLMAGYTDVERENFRDGTQSFFSEGDRSVFRYQGTLSIDDRNRLAFGAEREDSEANGDETSIDGLFALYEFQPVDTLTLTGGLRSDDHERFGSETTARVAAAFNPNDRLTVNASWGEGFKAPTIFQTTFFCCGATAANADLKPETSEAFDVGFTYRTADARGEVGLTYFDQDTENMIAFSFTLGGYENIARTESSGVELQTGYRFTDWFRATASYAFIDASDGSGEPLVRVPEHSGDLALHFDPDGPFRGAVLIRYNGNEPDDNGEVDAWTRVDLSASYLLSEQIELFARVENVLDEEYQQILGYGTPGVSGSVGARLRF